MLGGVAHDRHHEDADEGLAEAKFMAVGSIAPTMISLIQATPTVATASTDAARPTEAGSFFPSTACEPEKSGEWVTSV